MAAVAVSSAIASVGSLAMMISVVSLASPPNFELWNVHRRPSVRRNRLFVSAVLALATELIGTVVRMESWYLVSASSSCVDACDMRWCLLSILVVKNWSLLIAVFAARIFIFSGAGSVSLHAEYNTDDDDGEGEGDGIF